MHVVQNRTEDLNQTLRNWLARTLRGQPSNQPENVTVSQLISCAELEGVTTLVHHSLQNLSPECDLTLGFKNQAMQSTARAILLQEERMRVLHILQKVKPIVLKGEAMAYACYSQYQDRPMVDVDLLIKSFRMNEARDLLIDDGYLPQNSVSGNMVMPQVSFSKKLPANISNVLDLHTSLFNRPALQDMLTYDNLIAAAQQGVHRSGVIPCVGHLLIHAVLHLMAHHFNSRRLIWLYDINILLGKIDEENGQIVLDFCNRHKMAAAMLEIIDASSDLFPHNQIDLQSKLEKLAATQPVPHIATRLACSDKPFSLAIQDWRSLRGGRQRGAWLRQHLVPPSNYMLQKYKMASKWLLPFFYLWRILKGSVKLIVSK
ncbi:MAG: nucleotidyltransferase family protein [bacterium]